VSMMTGSAPPPTPTEGMVLREFDAADGDVLGEVFDGMSVDSRYLRYLTPMPTLPEQARRVLTAIDGCQHAAVAAFVHGHPVGLARIIGVGGHRAELALEVVDAWQGCGVGTLLAQWARDHAAVLGYTELVAETSAGNSRAQALTRKLFPGFTARREGTVIVFNLPVGSIRPTAA
jgi:GNAT superfamily N-acetyltransferase